MAYSASDVAFLRHFHATLETTKTAISVDMVSRYWDITQAHIDSDWRLGRPSGEYLRKLAAEVSETRSTTAFFRTPPELALKFLDK